MTRWIAIVFVAAMLTGCRRDTYYKQVVNDINPPHKLYIYWREYKPVSNIPGICAQVMESDDGKRWGGELHKKGTPMPDFDHPDRRYYPVFTNRADAEAWGDAQCPNK